MKLGDALIDGVVSWTEVAATIAALPDPASVAGDWVGPIRSGVHYAPPREGTSVTMTLRLMRVPRRLYRRGSGRPRAVWDLGYDAVEVS